MIKNSSSLLFSWLLSWGLLFWGFTFWSSFSSSSSSSSWGIISSFSFDSSALIFDNMFVLSLLISLPGQWNNFFSKSEVFGDVLLSFSVEEIVEILPVENQINESSVLEGSEEHSDGDVSDSSTLVWLGWIVLV